MQIRWTPSSTMLSRIVLFGILISTVGCNAMNGRVMNQQGKVYYKRGNYTAARHEFARAVADAPQNTDYRHNLATALKKQGDLAGAEQNYRRALFLNPAHQPSYHGLAMLLRDQGRQADASSLLSAWRTAQSNSAAPHIEMAWLQRESGDLPGAEQSLRQALQVRPNHPTALAQLGQLYENSGRQQQATAMYQRSLYRNWYQPRVKSRLAAIQDTRPRGRGVSRLARQTPRFPTAISRATPTFASPIPNADPAHTTATGSEIPATRPY